MEALADALAEALKAGPAKWPGLGSFSLQPRSGFDGVPDHVVVRFRAAPALMDRLGGAKSNRAPEGDSSWLQAVDSVAVEQIESAMETVGNGGVLLVKPLGVFARASLRHPDRPSFMLSFNSAPSFLRLLHDEEAAAEASIVLSASAALKKGQSGLYPEWSNGAFVEMDNNGVVHVVERPRE